MAQFDVTTAKDSGAKGGVISKRGRSWKTIYQDLLDYEPTDQMRVLIESMGLGKVSDLTWQKSIAAAMMAKAMAGDVQAARLITQTMEDQPGDRERPTSINVTIKHI